MSKPKRRVLRVEQLQKRELMAADLLSWCVSPTLLPTRLMEQGTTWRKRSGEARMNNYCG